MPVILTRRAVILLAIASAIVTANAYYIHPIIGHVAEEFGVSNALVGAVPALNQIALALGILLLLPLGDRLSNRKLTTVFLAFQVFALLIMAVAQSFWLFVAGSTLLGFFTITPYLLPAFVSKRVSVERLGTVTAILTTGVIAGVLISRTGAGIVGEHLGWRNIYWIAAALMTAATLVVPLLLDDDIVAANDARKTTYRQLISSLVGLLRGHPAVIVSGAIQGLSFGVFLCVWLGIGLHLTSPEMGFGVDDVGYLAAFSALNLMTTPSLGRLADRIGPMRTRTIAVCIQFLGVIALFFTDSGYWILLLPISLMSVAGPVVDITGRMSLLTQDPVIRTRLMTLYIVIMFLGGGLGSWAGTIAFELGGWLGTCTLATLFSVLAVGLSLSRLNAD
ncbi:MAG: putative MFS family arabinose efflux permease [Pseudohongiellaceae bacterium]